MNDSDSKNNSDSKVAYEAPEEERPATALPTEAQLENEMPTVRPLDYSPAPAEHDPYAAFRLPVYQTYLGSFLLALLLVVVLYPVRQVVVQWLILGGAVHWHASLLDSEIAQDRNVAAGLLEATAYVTTALFMIHIV